MKRRIGILAMAGAAFLATHWAASGTAQAQVPQYYVVQAPAPTMHAGGHGYYPAQTQPVARHRYAYGWFGAAPKRHWSRHFGYYRDYTQWSGH